MPNQLLENETDLDRPATGWPPSAQPTAPSPAGAPAPPDRGSRRGQLMLVGIGVAVLLVLALMGRIGDLLPSWDNPVKQTTVDRSTPPLLLALEDLNRYHAATGRFQLFIDREKDTRYVPSAISGERVSFLAVGTVDAYVDFTDLGPDRVRMSENRRAVSISLPAAQLGQARIDPTESRVLDRDRGVLDRVGSVFADDPSVEGELYAVGEKRLAAAAAESELVNRAEANTRQMLTSLATSLGFRQVTVTFDAAR